MPRTALIIFATGRDRPGIVDRITGLAYEAGANLEDSRMAVLGGEFALVALVTGRPEDLARVRDGTTAAARELDLTVQYKDTTAGPDARAHAEPHVPCSIRGVSIDHPGIVHKISRVLAQHGVNVSRLDTSLSHAPVSGAPMFSLDIDAEVPVSLPIVQLRARLQEVAERENIDLEVRLE